jgi:hypothetical protein
MEIAQYLLPQYAVISLRSLPARRRGTHVIDVSAPIVLGRVSYGGRSYISHAANSRHQKICHRPKAAYLLEDECGILDLHLSDSDFSPPSAPTPGAWWKIFPIGDGHNMVKVLDDVRSDSDPEPS